MQMKLCHSWYALLFLFAICNHDLVFGEFDPNAVPHTTKLQLTKMIENGTEEILVYFYTKFDDCPECKDKMPHFQEAAEYLEKLEDGNIKSYKLAVKFPEYGVNKFPQLIFFFGSTPFRYDKKDEFFADNIVDWVEEAKQSPLPELTDETFEHLTQASTGATTGDWLILFANGKRPECMKPYLPDIATTAVRLRRRKNVAIVDTSTNLATSSRFDMDVDNHCVAVLYFHRTDLYHYTSKDYSSPALLKYVFDDYTKDDALKVPPPHDNKNKEMESMISGLKDMFEEHININKLSFVGGFGFGLLAVFAAILFILNKFRKRKLL